MHYVAIYIVVIGLGISNSHNPRCIMTSEGRKRKRSESPDAVPSSTELSPLQPEQHERAQQPERAEQPDYTDVDQSATPRRYTDVDLPTTAQDYKDVDHPTTPQGYTDSHLPATPPDVPSIHSPAHSTFPETEEPTLPLTEEPYLQRSALSPAQLSPPHPESAEQPAQPDVDLPTTPQYDIDVDLPTTPPAVSPVHTPAIPTRTLTEEPHLQRSLLSPAQLSPTQLAYTDIDLPATPPVESPVHTPVRSTLPLTHANLRTIDPTMPRAAPQTPSKASSRNETSLPLSFNVTNSRELLKRYHCFIDDEEIEEANEEFFEEVRNLAIGQRHSVMKPESIKRTKDTWRNFKDTNETSFLIEFWESLIPKSRHPMRKDDEPSVPTPWLQDHLIPIRDKLFQEKCVPVVTHSNESEKQLLELLPKMKTPKPDILYGLKLDKWCTKQHRDITYILGLWASPNEVQVLPFLIVEGKSNNGNLEEAEVQAARAGTVLNAGWRGFDERCGTQPSGLGPDKRSKVFSLVLSPNYARLNIHWVNVEANKQITYHCHRLRYYTVALSQDWVSLRRDVENILDWGVLERKKMMLEMLDAKAKLDEEGPSKQGSSKKRKANDSVASGSGTGSAAAS